MLIDLLPLILLISSLAVIYLLAKQLVLQRDEIKNLKLVIKSKSEAQTDLLQRLSEGKKHIQDLMNNLNQFKANQDNNIASQTLAGIESFRRITGKELHDHVSGLLFAAKNQLAIASVCDDNQRNEVISKAEEC